MSYLAKFEMFEGHLFRFDTRIYLGEYEIGADSKCVGAIIGKNPGSAKPTNLGTLAPLDLDGDKMLPYVKNRFLAAYYKIGKTPAPNSFIRVWNLFYLCNKNIKEAKLAFESCIVPPFCRTETEQPPLVWFGWGGDDKFLNGYKERFINRKHNKPFFYNSRTHEMSEKVPAVMDSAKHPQGMLKLPVELHLAKVLEI